MPLQIVIGSYATPCGGHNESACGEGLTVLEVTADGQDEASPHTLAHISTSAPPPIANNSYLCWNPTLPRTLYSVEELGVSSGAAASLELSSSGKTWTGTGVAKGVGGVACCHAAVEPASGLLLVADYMGPVRAFRTDRDTGALARQLPHW